MTPLTMIQRDDPDTILKLADTESPPPRLGVGTTILPRARAAHAERIAAWEAWEDVANTAMGSR